MAVKICPLASGSMACHDGAHSPEFDPGVNWSAEAAPVSSPSKRNVLRTLGIPHVEAA
jgi:hypothetical protein